MIPMKPLLSRRTSSLISPRQHFHSSVFSQLQHQKQQRQHQERTPRRPATQKHKTRILVHGSSLEGFTTVLAMNQTMQGKNASVRQNVEVQIAGREQDQSRNDRTLVCSPNVMRVFDRLNVLDDVLQKGHVLGHYTACNSRGQNMYEVDLSNKSSKEFDGIPFVSIEESALLSVLSNAVVSTGIATMAQSGDSQLMNYDEKNEKITTSKRTVRVKRSYDLLIGADGTDSAIRKTFFAGVGADNIGAGKQGVIIGTDTNITLPAEFTPESNKYQSAGIILDCPKDLDYQDQCFEWNVMHNRMGVIPLRNDRIFIFAHFYQGGAVMTNMSTKGAQLASVYTRSFKNIRGLGGDMIINILDRIGKTPQHYQHIVAYTENMKSLVLKDAVHSSGKMVLVGGAAHAIDNTLWQQPTVDAEDGYVLGTRLGKALADGEDADMASALSQYNQLTVQRAKDLDQIGRMYSRASHRGYWQNDFVKTIKMMAGKKFLMKRRMNQAVTPNPLI